MTDNIILKEQPSQEDKSYGKTIYVSEDVFNRLMEMRVECYSYEENSGFVSIAGERFLSLGSMTFTEDRYLPKNTIMIPDPKEVKRLQKERYEKMVDGLKKFGELYGERL